MNVLEAYKSRQLRTVILVTDIFHTVLTDVVDICLILFFSVIESSITFPELKIPFNVSIDFLAIKYKPFKTKLP